MENVTGFTSESVSWVREIFAVTLFEEDLDTAKQFYRKVFGLAVVYEDANSAVFKFGSTMINLLEDHISR